MKFENFNRNSYNATFNAKSKVGITHLNYKRQAKKTFNYLYLVFNFIHPIG